jgi:transposase InsO family protein
VDLRLEFISRLRRGERIGDLSRDYGISRKTAHKLKKRWEQLGPAGLVDQSRAPRHIPHRTPPEIVELVLGERRQHPSWGPKKLKEVLEQRTGRQLPSASTVGEILVRAGLVEPRKVRPRAPRPATPRLVPPSAPNDVWSTDYKGQFRLGDRSYCYPLTASDLFSRFVLGIDGMPAIDDADARAAFEVTFATYGLPLRMRSDNGPPFASTGLAGLTRLSAYFLRLGIALERIKPGKPQENGCHERMHRTLKRETTRPPRQNLLQQQELFDRFIEEFNTERPHEALAMKRPADIYCTSPRKLPASLPEPDYSLCDDVLNVSRKGFIHLPQRGQVYLTTALQGHPVGVREEDDGRWTVYFTSIELGFVDPNRTTFTPAASTLPSS